MKFIILDKKIILIICLFVILFFSLFLYFYHPISLAVDLTTNTTFSDDLKEKFRNLTDNNEKIAYLTFDDGPTLKATGKILDILKTSDVKATFFVVGKHVKEHPELVKRAYDEGHYIANHGYNHNNSILFKNSENFVDEIKKTDIEIGNALGISDYCSHVFRFPNGYMSLIHKKEKKQALNLLSEINYTYIDWNCLNNDSVKKYTNYQLLNNLKKSSKNKGTLIILMHDTCDVNNTPAILTDSINYLKEQGYTFKNFYDLIN